MNEIYADAEGFERSTAHFSRQLARQFVPWMEVPRGVRWLDAGCGTGALTSAIIDLALPSEVVGIDTSEPYLSYARRTLPVSRFQRASVLHLPFKAASFDAVVAGLVIHHLDDPIAGLREMTRVTAPGGAVGSVDWDRQAELSRLYWSAASDVGTERPPKTENRLGTAEAMRALFVGAELSSVQVVRFAASVEFDSFNEWWTSSVVGRRGSAFAHYHSLSSQQQRALHDRARELAGGGGRFQLTAAAWAANARR